MKNRMLSTTFGLAAALALTISPHESAAAPGAQAKSRQVSGEVMSVKRISAGATGGNLFAVIRTNKGGNTLLVDLGAGRGLNVQKGESISAEGKVARVRNRPVMIATRVRDDGRTTRITRP